MYCVVLKVQNINVNFQGWWLNFPGHGGLHFTVAAVKKFPFTSPHGNQSLLIEMEALLLISTLVNYFLKHPHLP